jgi:hypothetical protein
MSFLLSMFSLQQNQRTRGRMEAGGQGRGGGGTNNVYTCK